MEKMTIDVLHMVGREGGREGGKETGYINADPLIWAPLS